MIKHLCNNEELLHKLKQIQIKKYKSIIKKKKKKHDEIILLAKSKLNCIEVLISEALINSDIVMMNLF